MESKGNQFPWVPKRQDRNRQALAMTTASKIKDLDIYHLWVPTRTAIRREMERAHIHRWSEVEVIHVTLESGAEGIGETIVHYTWGRPRQPEKTLGRNPAELMWDDNCGAGLQMALFDAVGKELGVPVHRLLGVPLRTHCPVSHWGHDMPPALYAQEARRAVERGYTSMKIKARPWFDVRETLHQISVHTPDGFQIDADWNDFLLSGPVAVAVMQELIRDFPKLSLVEGPLPVEDSEGNRSLMRAITLPVAHHYSDALARRILDGKVCDGFVMAGGVSQIMRGGLTAASLNMPFFLQMVGTGLTTAMAVHLGAVLSHAQWPAITCHEIYEDDLVMYPLPVCQGYVKVGEQPGLGVTLDMEAVSRYAMQGSESAVPPRVLQFSRSNGMEVCFADNSHNLSAVWSYFKQGNQPVCERGVNMTMWDIDGNPELAEIHRQAREGGPVVRFRERTS